MFKGNLMCYERFCNIPDLIIEPTLLKEGICEAVTRGAHPGGEEKEMRIDECVAGIDEECGNGEGGEVDRACWCSVYTEARKCYEGCEDEERAPYYQAYRELYCEYPYAMGGRQPRRSVSEFPVPLPL
jgi:hypothetical protein